MGHQVWHLVYDENVDKKAVQSEGDEKARAAGRGEGSSGLLRSIRWLDHVCADREEAEKYIESHDSGWYDQLAVRFREYQRLEPSKAMTSLKMRLVAEMDKKTAYEKAHSVSTFKAEFIGCPKCGSRLKRTLLKREYCPLCGTELRSQTTMDTLRRYEKNIRNLEKKIEEEERNIQMKNVDKSKVKWLVKIEYHV